MYKTEERRVVTVEDFRASTNDSGEKIIEGYAAVFDKPAEIGWFTEVVKPSAFNQTLKMKADVRALFNHDKNYVLGRTKSGTLSLSVDKVGLRFKVVLPETQIAQDLYVSIERGDISQCSFGFQAVQDKWTYETDEDGNEKALRELIEVKLFDVSPVTFPAYDQTSVTARDVFGVDSDDSILAEITKKLKYHKDISDDEKRMLNEIKAKILGEVEAETQDVKEDYLNELRRLNLDLLEKTIGV